MKAFLPSEVGFSSFLEYSPKGTTPASVQSKNICYALKNDGPISFKDASGNLTSKPAVPEVVRHLKQCLPQHECLRTCFGSDCLLVPVPRSSPLYQGALWPTQVICQELVKQGIAANYAPILERHQPARKSATASSGQRPGPQEHYQTTRILNLPLLPGNRITLVDDVVTRGASFLGMWARLREAFPQAEIHCFAMVRTMSGVEVEKIVSPVSGIISYTLGFLQRRP